MLRGLTLPGTLLRVLDPLRSCFTAPSFETLTVLVAQPVGRSVLRAGTAPHRRTRPATAHGRPDRHCRRDRPLRALEDPHRGPLRHHRHGGDHRTHMPVVGHLAHRPRPRHPRSRYPPHDQPPIGYDIALGTTDLDATPEEIIARYASFSARLPG
jgi:hypothetical protein